MHRGASQPLLRPTKHDPEIHGIDGLGGVEGLPSADHHLIRDRCDKSKGLRATEGMAKSIQDTLQNASGEKVTIISTGPMTNIALFVTVYPDLLVGVEQFIFMGGGVGLGNRSAVAGTYVYFYLQYSVSLI